METVKKYLPFLVALLVFALPLIADAASVTIPSYAGGQNLDQQANNAGQNIANFLLVLAGIVGVVGGTWGAILMGIGKAQEGKEKLFYAVIGVFIAGSIGGILKLVTG